MGTLKLKIINFCGRHCYFGYFFVAIFGAAFFGLIQANNTFADPDSFYHAKMATLMLEQRIVRGFPWLVYTVLPQIYTDHHFLYHVFLLPFARLFSPLIGIKIATVAINTAFILFFYYFLRKNKIPRPFFFVFLLASAAPFIFRIDLAKANGLSLIFVMLILIFLFTPSSPPPLKGGGRRGWILAPLSFLYVWSYGGWPIGIFIAGVYFIASVIANLIFDSSKREQWLHGYIVTLLKNAEWKPLAATVGGSLAGLIINPYFPQNLKFYWLQIVQIAVINYQGKIGVGGEWYQFDLAELVSYSGPVFLVFVFGMLFFFGKIFLAKNKEISRAAAKYVLFFIISSGAFFILTLKSRRNTEYFYPFAILAAAFIFKYFWDNDLYLRFKKNIQTVLRTNFFYRAFIAYLFLAFALNFGLNFWKIKRELARGFAFDYYKEAMEIAKQNSRPGDIIFHSDWDDWPMLFYHNSYNRYIVGLDTTFMYKYNPELYKKWRDVTWGDFTGDPYSIIKNDFQAAIVFMAQNDINTMDKYFKNDARYELLYDKEGRLYGVK